MKFQEVLESFKEEDENRPEAIVPLVTDSEMCDALVAWSSIQIAHRPDSDCPHGIDDRHACWAWLWEQTSYHPETFATVSGLKPTRAKEVLQRLVHLRLAYPDGGISALARGYLQAVIRAKLPKPRGRPPKS